MGIGVMEPTTMSLRLADRSIKYRKRIVENVLLKIDEFIFQVDFVVLYMDDDREAPLILWCPFLGTRRVVIDVRKGELILRLNEAQIVFNMFNNDTLSPKVNYCLKFDVLNTYVGGSVHVRDVANYPSLNMEWLATMPQNPRLPIKEPPELGSKFLPSYLKYFMLVI